MITLLVCCESNCVFETFYSWFYLKGHLIYTVCESLLSNLKNYNIKSK